MFQTQALLHLETGNSDGAHVHGWNSGALHGGTAVLGAPVHPEAVEARDFLVHQHWRGGGASENGGRGKGESRRHGEMGAD